MLVAGFGSQTALSGLAVEWLVRSRKRADDEKQ
jgi:hypothetical protein